MLGNVEDIVAFAHPYGCSQMGEDQENTRKVLATSSIIPTRAVCWFWDWAVKTAIYRF